MRQGGAALLPPLSLSSAQVVFTGRAEGDMGHGGDRVVVVRTDVAARRRAVVDLPWTWLRQVHGARVVRVDEPGGGAGTVADAAVTDRPGCALAVLTADCAPVAFASPEGVIGVAHAGWRGAVAGVLEATVAEMRALGATTVTAVIGPCIRPGCYEFGPPELDDVASHLGDGMRASTTDGRPALDLPAAVRTGLARAGVAEEDVRDIGLCTACGDGHFSWRARRERQRQAAVIWR
ncbi:MAG: polyphenol oxidase family protein [Actinomycetota bacterium]|nr:polyphenol oxidase family protein [Actinomycetota bacterium]